MVNEVLRHVQQEPGIWTAKLCRQLNGLPETVESVIYCGQCSHYANPRKRERAANFQRNPTLPGMEAPHQLHDPCNTITLKRLQYLLYSLLPDDNMDNGRLICLQEQVIPDSRNWRGWDYATRWYPLEGDEWLEQLFKE